MTRAILIATNRSGSTFLNHALDSHYAIGWERGEPLTELRDHADPVACVHSVLDAKRGYKVVGCKLSYRYLRDVLTWDGLARLEIDRLIHLYRADAVRTTLSAMINIMARDGKISRPYHTTEPLPPVHITVNVDDFVNECLRYVGNVRSMKQAIMDQDIPTFTMTYADLVNGEGNETNHVFTSVAHGTCLFLGVPYAPLTANLRRVNPQPIDDIVTNWTELAHALAPYEGELYV